MNPLHGKVLIEDTCIDDTVSVDFVGSKEAERAEAVLDCHTDKVVVVGVDERGEVVLSVSCAVSTTVDPDHDW